MHTNIEFVTPKRASELLSINITNRKLNERNAIKLSDAMKRGEWQFNGDTIRISDSGKLLDGQHRLRAIELSGIGQSFVVVYGLPDDVFKTIDTGSLRTASQMLAMKGNKRATNLASAARLYLTWEKTGNPVHGTHSTAPTNTQMIDFVDNNPKLAASAEWVQNKRWLSRYGVPSNATFCHFVFSELVSAELAYNFFKELDSGEFSYSDSPVKIMREILIEDKGRGSSRLRKSVRIAMYFKAIKAYKDKAKMKILRLPKDTKEWYKL